MAEFFMYNIIDAILQRLSSLVMQEIGLICGVKSELQELQNKLSTIRAVLMDAEERQATNRELHDWLVKLKDTFTDADVLLDEVEIEYLQQRSVNDGFIRKVRDSLPSFHSVKFRWSMGHKLEEFNQSLDNVAALKAKFHLTERFEVRRIEGEMTHSFVRSIDVIGRNDEKENIIKMMYSSDDNEHVSVIPIVGIGGLGKTTLAKLVYNDEKVVELFQIKIWVCMSVDFSLEIVARRIITSATFESCGELGMEQLQSILRTTLLRKKFLLVLDDVWNADLSKWVELKDLLKDGARGSKIIVTTRSSLVASIVGGTYQHNLRELEQRDCFALFLKWAFPKGEERKHPNLLKIGEEIANKCKGVPLAAMKLGCRLRDKTDERDWLRVRHTEIWKLEDQRENSILTSLKLSYGRLPFHLKQCFAYCSLFPRGQYVCKDNLIRLWMAQGLIWSTDQNQELEDVGNQYFDELCSELLLQKDEQSDPFYVTFTIHDLIHDLAQSVAQTECIRMRVHTGGLSSTVRHVSFLDCDYLSGEAVPREVLELEKLRTIFFPRDGKWSIRDCFVDKCISSFLLLRTIDLSDSCFKELPDSIGDVRYLRYLDLSRNHKIKTLPKSICKLLKLQTLQLSDCKELEQLPKNVGNLISLRHLHITTQQRFFPEKGIGCFTSLRSLWISGCVNLVSLPKDFKNLTALRTLVINRCPRLDSLPSCMASLSALKNLMINDCEDLNLSEAGGIQGPRIRTMVIGELPNLVAFPGWLCEAARSIHYLRIVCCPKLRSLPEWLKNSASMEKIEILECPKLLMLPEGFHRLHALKVLRISKCEELIRRYQQGTGEDWKMIAHIPEIHLD